MTSSEGSVSNPIEAITSFLRSTIGAKFLVAVTGLLMGGFLFGHMAGNLQVLLPPGQDGYWGQQINEYAHFLKTTPALLWGTRLGLLGSIVLHIVLTMRLQRLNMVARPIAYGMKKSQRSTLLGRLMHISGFVVLGYLVFHLLQFTLPGDVIQPGGLALRDKAGIHDVYNMVRDGFRTTWVVVLYVVANALICGHLWHGFMSVQQTLGIQHKTWTPLLNLVGRLLVLALLAGNLSMPIVVYIWHLQGS